MERRARLAQAGWTSGRGLRGRTSGRVALRLDRTTTVTLRTAAGPRGQPRRAWPRELQYVTRELHQVSDRCLHALRVWRVLLVGARPLQRREDDPHQLLPRAGLVDRRVGPPRNTDDPLCGRPVVRLGNEDRAAMR